MVLRLPLLRPSVLLFLPMVALSGCGHGDHSPTVAEAEQKLAKQMSVLVAQVKRTGGKDIRMSVQSERHLQCPKGKTRRGVAFTGNIITSERKPPFHVAMLLIGVAEMSGIIDKDAYKITNVRIGDPRIRLHNARTRTNLILDSPGVDEMIIRGFTDCLKMK